jgi:protease I
MKVAILVEDLYEDLELWVPLFRLREAGHAPVLVGPQAG